MRAKPLGVVLVSPKSKVRGFGAPRAQQLADVRGVGAFVPADGLRELEQLAAQRAALDRVGVEGGLQVLDGQREAQDLGVLLGRGRR